MEPFELRWCVVQCKSGWYFRRKLFRYFHFGFFNAVLVHFWIVLSYFYFNDGIEWVLYYAYFFSNRYPYFYFSTEYEFFCHLCSSPAQLLGTGTCESTHGCAKKGIPHMRGTIKNTHLYTQSTQLHTVEHILVSGRPWKQVLRAFVAWKRICKHLAFDLRRLRFLFAGTPFTQFKKQKKSCIITI